MFDEKVLGWFSNRTGTSVDDGAHKSNSWVDQWKNDVPVLLLNQPTVECGTDVFAIEAKTFSPTTSHYLFEWTVLSFRNFERCLIHFSRDWKRSLVSAHSWLFRVISNSTVLVLQVSPVAGPVFWDVIRDSQGPGITCPCSDIWYQTPCTFHARWELSLDSESGTH